MTIKKLFTALSLLLLVSCGSEDNPIGIPLNNTNGDGTPAIIEELAPYVDCEEYTLTNHPEYEKVYKCNASEGYLLQHGGDVVFDAAFSLDIYLGFIVDPHHCDDSNLIVNGSFEDGHDLGENKWGLFDTLDGWEADLENINAGIEVQHGQSIGGIAPSDGNTKIELDAHAKNGYSKSNARVVQYVSTQSNKSYILKFDYSARINGNNTTNKAKVFWNGEKIKSVNSDQRGWTTYQLVVSGSDELSKLEFRGAGTEDSLGGYIDNVSLKEICSCN